MTLTPCEQATQEYDRTVKWVERWNMLIYVFGIAVIGCLITAIGLLVRATILKESFGPGLISTLGTIVSGVGTTWVQSKRREHRAEWKEAKDDIAKSCKEQIKAAMTAENQLATAPKQHRGSKNPLILVVLAITLLWTGSSVFLIHQVNETKAAKSTAEFGLGQKYQQELAAITAGRDELKAQLAKALVDFNTLRNLSFVVRVDTFNGHSATYNMSVDDLTKIHNEKVLFPDFADLPGFDKDKGIARKLLIQRK